MDKHQELVELAKSLVGIEEEGGDNKGEWVERFQREIDGKAVGEPWCAGFVQFCINEIDRRFDAQVNMSQKDTHNKIYRSELCYDIWHKTPVDCRLMTPIPGCIVVWNYNGTKKGHCGIVIEINDKRVVTIEGNTSDSKHIEREGDGIFLKKRDIWKTTGKMRTLGYLNPWKK